MTALETAVHWLKEIAKEGPAGKTTTTTSAGPRKPWGPGNPHWCRDKALNALKLVANAKHRDKRAAKMDKDPVMKAFLEWRVNNTTAVVYDQKTQRKLIEALRHKYEEG